MLKHRLTIVAAIVVLAVALLFVAALLTGSQGERETRMVVEDFGGQLQNVSVLSTDASSMILQSYERFVTPELLSLWTANPEVAPGRRTSSPWPARIEIDNVVPQGAGYLVTGEVVLETADGEAGREAVTLQVIPVDGQYRIAIFQPRVQP